MKFRGVECGELVKIITVIDVFVGFVSEIDTKNKVLWITQNGNMRGGIYFGFEEILKIIKLNQGE